MPFKILQHNSMPPQSFTLSRLAACLLISVGLLLSGCGKSEDAVSAAKPTETSQPIASLAVSLVSPQQVTWPRNLAASGNIAAWQEVVIGSEISGFRLLEVKADIGDQVRKGQLLALINSDSIQAELRQSRAAVAEAEALLSEAIVNAKRAQSLKDSGAASSLEISQYLTGQQTTLARLEAAKARVQADEVRLAQTRIVAPDDGIIATRVATVGALTQQGQELFRLVRDQRLEWRAEVTAAELGQIKTGMTAQIQPPDAQQAMVTGRVRSVAPVVDGNTRNGLIYVDLPKSSALQVGMFAQGQFTLGQKTTLSLPQAAVLLRDGFAYVFVVDAQQKVSQQKITLGQRVADQVEVIGLAETAQVAASGVAFLADGDQVKVTEAIPTRPASINTSIINTATETATTTVGAAE